MHIKKNNWNINSISGLVKMHARHLRIWLYLHQHKLPSENKAQLISGNLICLDENECLIDLVVRRIMQEYEAAGCSHSGLLWRCVLVARAGRNGGEGFPQTASSSIPGELRGPVARRHHNTECSLQQTSDSLLPLHTSLVCHRSSNYFLSSPNNPNTTENCQLWEMLFIWYEALLVL